MLWSLSNKVISILKRVKKIQIKTVILTAFFKFENTILHKPINESISARVWNLDKKFQKMTVRNFRIFFEISIKFRLFFILLCPYKTWEQGAVNRAVERTEDFTWGPGKILKYDSKRGKFCSLGPSFEAWATVKITTSPPPLYGPDSQCSNSQPWQWTM